MAEIRGILVAAGALAAAIMLAGCASDSGGATLDPVGTWGDPNASSSPYLELADDGTLSGSDGCNRLSGQWKLDEADQVEFGQVASTLMACEGVDTWLANLSVAEISGSTMTVLSSDGSKIGTLERYEGSAAPTP